MVWVHKDLLLKGMFRIKRKNHQYKMTVSFITPTQNSESMESLGLQGDPTSPF